ncbi:MAG: lysophospholipid acyltransferase family protein [Dissulfuribacterales bacterium]
MKNKSEVEKTDKFSERLVAYFFLLVIKIFPENILYFFAQTIGNMTYFSAGKRRELAIKNLTIAFKNEKSSREIKKIARQAFCEIVWSWFETSSLAIKKGDINKKLAENITVEGIEYLDAALKNNKGVICVSAHFGNFMFLTLRLAGMGYPCKTIVKNRKTPFGTNFLQDLQKRIDMEWISARPRIQAVSKSLKCLKNNNILFLYTDQNRKDGVCVNFFNRPAYSVRGPAMFHLRTGAEILCAFIIRIDRNKHKIVVTPPLKFKKTGDREEDVCRVTQAYTSIIEDFVRRYPEQWWWPHKRWTKDIQ